MAADYIKQIWVPDTFFVNEKTAYFHVATQENQFLRITHLGEILRSMRLTVKATCPMDLSYFPMDSQLCTLEIESYGYTMADLVYSWHDGVQSVQVGLQYNVLSHFFIDLIRSVQRSPWQSSMLWATDREECWRS